ncbi:4-hydroxybenzoate octaprenyltransferase [Acuticoccus mangrovi]|uniref:4-hydroxybenzoate octaprenyltransferase n=1 Tax=Acuticoccus mangrovi TaxID=2796142 RepID=A0A934ITL9_9HYPH|nr:4-hydroxybenzoate octaprenyltransferase [Acuticoccus mangrovi]MBJ3778596.1 4-hydroxybenzoate octaprenyltransferase [Acuticoccus mangrovi]
MTRADTLDLSGRVADAPADNWVDRLLPAKTRPYARLARLDRPIGWWLLLWPCWWSVGLAAVAAGHVPNVWHLALFLVGAVAMRGAGCTYNDILDRNIDAHVERTRSRPIPSGQVSTDAAFLFLLAEAFVGLAVVLQFNAFTVMVAFGSLAIVALYPLAKRVTDWPQIVLGFAFSWGAFLGWSATFGSLAVAPFFLYAGSIAWTVGYDTIYAHQDRRDDAIIGVRSTARLFGENTKLAVGLCYAATVTAFAVALALAGAGVWGFLGLALFAAHLARQVTKVTTEDPASCLAAFRSNRTAGFLLFAGLVAEALF